MSNEQREAEIKEKYTCFAALGIERFCFFFIDMFF